VEGVKPCPQGALYVRCWPLTATIVAFSRTALDPGALYEPLRPWGAAVTFTVSRTSVPAWPGQGNKIVLVIAGDLTGWGWPKVAGLIAETEDSGVDRIVLDLRAVGSCDREALFELLTVRGRWPSRRSCVVDVVGARRVQFVHVLAQEPLQQRHDLQVVINDLCRPQVVPAIDSNPVPSKRLSSETGLSANGQTESGASRVTHHPEPVLLDHLPHEPLPRGRHHR
jgi:hypothetical protein